VNDLPYFVWWAPLALYVGVILCRAVPNLYWRGLLIMAALAGNILLLRGYTEALAALDRLQRWEAGRCWREHPAEACPNPYPLSESSPLPNHWEWAQVAYVLAAAGLYFLLYVVEQRMARREADAVERLGGDPPGA